MVGPHLLLIKRGWGRGLSFQNFSKKRERSDFSPNKEELVKWGVVLKKGLSLIFTLIDPF